MAALVARIGNALRWRWRVAETVAALIAARLLIRFVPFARWRDLLGPLHHADVEPPRPPGDAQRRLARAVARDVARWSRRLPFDIVCLPQAMAARWVLRRRGIESRIMIGARSGQAAAAHDLHAWLMVGDQCVTGEAERRSFEAFASGAAAQR